MLTIEYWDEKGNGDSLYTNLDILYGSGFRQVLYLDAILTHPEYPLDEEGTEDAEGVFNATWLKWRKTYHVDFICAEYLVDAIMTLPMHNNVYIDGMPVKEITVEVNWEGNWAVVDLSFVTDEVIRGNCCNNLILVNYNNTRIPGGECFEPTLDPVLSGLGYNSGQWLDPLNNGIAHGDRYMFITILNIFDATVQGKVYEFVINQWVEDVAVEGDGVYVGGVGNMYFDGVWWNAYPYIAMINQTGTDEYHITGFALPETWVTVQYSVDNVNWVDAAVPVWSGAFNTLGLTVSVTEGDYYWRIESWTWSCPYDPLNVKYKESGFWLINDGGDFFLQNSTSTDKWYR